MKKQPVFLFAASIGVIASLTIWQPPCHAVSEETAEQRSLAAEARKEEALEKPETAKDVIEMLKERALLKLEKKRREALWKTNISAAVYAGFENNPLNDSSTKGDYFSEENFFASWRPAFNEKFSANIGYSLIEQDYFEQTDVSSLNSSVNAILKYYPLESGKLRLEPGIEHEWLYYPKDEMSSYENTKHFIKFRHTINEKWNYGGKYEHSFKAYDKKRPRNAAQQYTTELNREDNRHTAELYITRFIGKYSAKVKGKIYRNTSNDHYQEYYDYDSWRAYLTLGRTFFKDERLNISFTPSFERKNYARRIAVNTARYDDVREYKADVTYQANKDISLSFNITHKEVDSNYVSGEYHDVTNKIGISYDF